ncbi:MAG: glycosyltransferase [Bacteroidia bacterium]|nr:glycosyltransferase [Bacteroidia bacterium]
MKKVLVITYYWPPGAGPGVQRWLKFCKYLREFDWEPIVLTVKNGSYPSIDKSLINDIPANLEIHKTKAFEPFTLYNILRGKSGNSMSVGMIGINDKRSFLQRIANHVRANYFIPDARKGWNSYAIQAANNILDKENISAVISTGPPHSTHLIAQKICNKHGIPWLADFRDPWVNVYYNKFFPRTDSTKKKDQDLENSVLEQANVSTVVSEGLKLEFEDRAKRVEVLYNGYDESDYTRSDNVKGGEKFTISYIGNFKPNQNVHALWELLSELVKTSDDFKKHLLIRLIGNVDPQLKKDIIEMGLEEHVSFEDFVDHKKAVSFMQASTILLFIIPQVKDNHLILTGKLFEYMASGTKMLSIGPVDGNAAKIISECDRGSMIDYENKDAMKEQLIDSMKTFKLNASVPKLVMNSSLLNYSRKGQTEQLAKVLNEISKND